MVVAKNSVNSTVNRKQRWWVQGDIIKVWLEGLWLSSIFNIFKILTLGRISPRYHYLTHFGGAYFHWNRSLKAYKKQRGLVWAVFEWLYFHKVLKFRHPTCFRQGAPSHSDNYRVKIYSETRTCHNNNIQLLFSTLIKKCNQPNSEKYFKLRKIL